MIRAALLALGLTATAAQADCILPDTVPSVWKLPATTLAERIETCITKGADFTAPAASGRIPFGAIVSATDQPALISRMLAHGADPNTEFGDGSPAFFFAAFPARDMPAEVIFEKLDILGRAGADFNRDNNGYVLLVNAAEKRDAKMVQLLLHHGANPNAVDGNRVSALYVTLPSDRCDSLTGTALLEAGASTQGLPVENAVKLFERAEVNCRSNAVDRAYLAKLRILKAKTSP